MLEALVNAGKPLSVADVHARLSHHHKANLVSVYRTVQLFVNLGILRSVDASAGSQRFELVEPYNEHHHHLICTRCGEIVELEGCLLTEKALSLISHRVQQDKQFEVTGHEVQIFGRCGDCSLDRRSAVGPADSGNVGGRWAGRGTARKMVKANG